MQPQQSAQVSQPLNVRFVSGSQGVPLARPHPPPPHPQSHPHHHMQTPSPSSPYVQAAYAPRVRHSLDSALQGWSEYAYEPQPEGGGGGGGGQGMGTGLTSRGPSFGNVPMKRTWDSSMRDHGGGE